MTVGFHEAWADEPASALSTDVGRGIRPAPRDPRGCVQRLGYELDGLVVSQLSKLAPPDLQTRDPAELLEDLRAFGGSADFARYSNNPASVFPAPGRVRVRKRWLAPHRVGFSEWRWKSEHPILFRDVEDEYRARTANRTALLRLLSLRVKGKPMAILVNGFSSGHHLIERAAWPMREFHRKGVGVSLFALPFHGPRGRGFPPEWPHRETAFTIEGFRQAIWDLRIAVRALRRAGASHVGVVGMSLGGYTASLLATATADIDFMMAYIPIASLADVMHDVGVVPGTGAARQALYEGYRDQLLPITPTHRRPAIEPHRIKVISGEFDQIATVQHGARLAAHFGARQITFPGAHLVQNKRSRAFRRALTQFQRDGVLPRRR